KGNQRLSQLVAAIELILPWIQIAHDPLQAVRCADNEHRPQERQHTDQRQESGQPDATQENHCCRRCCQHHRSTKVRLCHQQSNCEHQNNDRFEKTQPGVQQFLSAAHHVSRQVGNQTQLGHFRNLYVEQPHG